MIVFNIQIYLMELINMEIYYFLIVISFKMASLMMISTRFKMMRLFLMIMTMIVCLRIIKVLMIRKAKVRKIKKHIFDPHYFIILQSMHIKFAITAHYVHIKIMIFKIKILLKTTKNMKIEHLCISFNSLNLKIPLHNIMPCLNLIYIIIITL